MKISPVDLLIAADFVVTADDADRVIEDGAIAVHGGKILATGSRAEIERACEPKERLGGPGYAVMPGLVNAHTHVPMVYFRGLADDLPLMEWLEKHIWPAEGRWLDEEFCRDASELACLEMIRAGVTLHNNMYFYGHETATVTRAAGLRGVMGAGIVDFPSKTASTLDEYLGNAEKLIRTWKGDDLIVPAVAPHAPYTCSPETLTRANALAERHDVPLHIHISETAWEVAEIERRFGQKPVHHLDALGILSGRLSAAHAVWLSPDEIEVLARRGVSVIHCPESNLKLASGFAPVPEMLAAGVRVGLGTDGAASNNDQGIFPEMSTAAKIHKARTSDPTVLPARVVVRMATRSGAEALGLGGVTGSLEPGKSADLILIDLRKPHLLPIYDVQSHLVYAVSSSDVSDVVVNGRVLMKDRVVRTLDEASILEKARYWQQKIRSWHEGRS